MTPRRGPRLLRLDVGGDVGTLLALARLPPAADASVAASVRDQIADVRARGDAALLDAVRRFDWACPGEERLRVTREALARAADEVGPEVMEALSEAAASIRAFHALERPAGGQERRAGGLRAGIRTVPLEAAGLYVPGGRASYPSTVLMLAIPAQIAGVRRLAVASPAGPGGEPAAATRAAAALLGIDEVYAVGGAAAIAALALGTPRIPRVDKIVGPGNAWVAEAKRQVFGLVGIDSISGPTELVILSDGTAPPAFVAADLLAQAEHDPLASAILLTTDAAEIPRVEEELERRMLGSPREAIQRESLAARGALVACRDAEVACAAARALAPEHLEVLARDAEAWASRVPSAAAVFLGPWAPEAAGDYGAGPNHSLPTGGTARFSSPVGVWDFVRCQSYLEMDRAALAERAGAMRRLAAAEGLDAHAASIAVRVESPEPGAR